ncbi:MAG: hypothetical protein KAR16_11510 [Bacteroidales bacterium]|nr:hypothetical protein [Bacteroidales bacterium]
MRLVPTLSILRSLVFALLLITFNSCNFAQSVDKDLATGLSTRGDGLSCEEVYLSDGEKIIKRNTFSYGETFYVNFDGMGGFERDGKSAFPNMQLVIVSDRGDTALFINDMYDGYQDGIENSPLELYGEVTVADPIHTEGEYTLYVTIRDKKGDGSFRAKLKFDVEPNERIAVTSNQVSSREIYLFSEQSGHTITDGRVGFNENIFLIFEGLEGFSVEAGQVYLGLSLEVKDGNGNLILDEGDLLGDDLMNFEMVNAQLAPNFILTGSQIANPVTCKVRIWDKRGTAWINTSTEIDVN